MHIRVVLASSYSKGPGNDSVTINVENIEDVHPMSGEPWHTWISLKNPRNGEGHLISITPYNEVMKQLNSQGIEFTDY